VDGHVVEVAPGVLHGDEAFAFAFDGYPEAGHPSRDCLVKVNHFVAFAIVVLISTTIANPTVHGDVGRSIG
jgi:hypothetical protein